jgi:hypothetical protein
MSRVLRVLDTYLIAKGMTREEFAGQLREWGYEDEVGEAKAVMAGKAEARVLIVDAAEEVLDVGEEGQRALLEAGLRDAEEKHLKRTLDEWQ